MSNEEPSLKELIEYGNDVGIEMNKILDAWNEDRDHLYKSYKQHRSNYDYKNRTPRDAGWSEISYDPIKPDAEYLKSLEDYGKIKKEAEASMNNKTMLNGDFNTLVKLMKSIHYEVKYNDIEDGKEAVVLVSSVYSKDIESEVLIFDSNDPDFDKESMSEAVRETIEAASFRLLLKLSKHP